MRTLLYKLYCGFYRLLLDHHVILKEDGLDYNIIKIKPPLCFTKENADTIVGAIDKTITDITKEK